MQHVFADTHYWIAMTDSADAWHAPAMAASQRVESATIGTTDEVLVEFLNAYSARGWYYREMACQLVYRLRREGIVTVLEQSRETFDLGLIMYFPRHDKAYSLVDCISMNTMRRMEITQVLTHDRHFAQEGFEVPIA